MIGSFYRDEVFNNGEHLPDTIEVREYTNTTYDALMTKQKQIESLEEELHMRMIHYLNSGVNMTNSVHGIRIMNRFRKLKE